MALKKNLQITARSDKMSVESSKEGDNTIQEEETLQEDHDGDVEEKSKLNREKNLFS